MFSKFPVIHSQNMLTWALLCRRMLAEVNIPSMLD